MEISLFQDDEPLGFERIIVYPYPDLKRIWVRMWITPKEDVEPNVDIAIINPDGSENCSASMLAQTDTKLEKTLHMKDSIAGTTYKFAARLSQGMTESPDVIDFREFDMVLEFRNPQAKEAGFGFGVNWDEYQRQE